METRSKAMEEHFMKYDKEINELEVAFQDVKSYVKAVDERIAGRLDTIEGAIAKMNKRMADTLDKYESVLSMMAQMANGKGNGKEKIEEISSSPCFSGTGILAALGNSYYTSSRSNGRMNIKLPKIDFPYFNGEGPREWL